MQAALDALDLEKERGDWGSVDFSKLEMDWTEEPEYCRADFLKKGVGQKDPATGKCMVRDRRDEHERHLRGDGHQGLRVRLRALLGRQDRQGARQGHAMAGLRL